MTNDPKVTFRRVLVAEIKCQWALMELTLALLNDSVHRSGLLPNALQAGR